MIKSNRTLSEIELASIAEKYLNSKHWECYPEVVMPIFGGRPDIIATKGQLCLVAETKKTLSYPVIEQLTRWHAEFKEAQESSYQDESIKGIPHLMVAIVQGRQKISPLKREIIMRFNIGVWEVYPRIASRPMGDCDGCVEVDGEVWRVVEIISPKFQMGSRHSAKNIINHLNQDMKIGVAGSTKLKDAYMTPFKRTMKSVYQFLEASKSVNQDLHVQCIVNYLNANDGHHYCNDHSAVNGIISALKRDGWEVNYNRVALTPLSQCQ